MNLTELIPILKQNGIVGAGGAGFPTYVKLDKKADTLILNCAECEPLLKLHRQVLEKYAYEIVGTLEMIADAVEAKEVIIGIKPSYKKAVAAVEAVLSSMKKTKIGLLPEVYPAGDEVILIYETTGRVVPPGNIPISVGVTVFNVETILNIYNAIHKDEPVISKYITVTGEVKNPVTLKVPLGITMQEVVDLAGGATVEEPVLINGGPMTGMITNPFDPVTKTTNAILVMPKDHYIVSKRTSKISIDINRAMSVCCQCRLCTDLCSRNLLG
ncbi:MAG: SLBB domain-containing protein, partial [Clostridia bacterium]|nr:SLBB domain-containing protein [Clostridia bacterium]